MRYCTCSLNLTSPTKGQPDVPANWLLICASLRQHPRRDPLPRPNYSRRSLLLLLAPPTPRTRSRCDRQRIVLCALISVAVEAANEIKPAIVAPEVRWAFLLSHSRSRLAHCGFSSRSRTIA